MPKSLYHVSCHGPTLCFSLFRDHFCMRVGWFWGVCDIFSKNEAQYIQSNSGPVSVLDFIKIRIWVLVIISQYLIFLGLWIFTMVLFCHCLLSFGMCIKHFYTFTFNLFPHWPIAYSFHSISFSICDPFEAFYTMNKLSLLKTKPFWHLLRSKTNRNKPSLLCFTAIFFNSIFS